MAVFRRNETYWYEFMFKGIRYRESSKSSNKSVAQKLEAEHKRKLSLGLQGLKPDSKPQQCGAAMLEFIESKELHWAFKTTQQHRNSLKHLMPFFGKMPLNGIDGETILRYQRERKKAGVTGRTINIEVNLLRMTMHKAKLWANIADEYKPLKENKDIGRALSHDETERLLASCKASSSRALYTAVLLCAHTSLRSQEVRTLKWNQVNFQARLLTVGKSKTERSTGREIPLNHTAYTALEAWRAQFPAAEPHHYIFPREIYHMKGLNNLVVYETFPLKCIDSFASSWRTAKQNAGVEARFHDLRHTAISRMADSGALDHTIMSIAGHMSPKMKEHYSHTRSEAKRAAVEALDSMSPQNPHNELRLIKN